MYKPFQALAKALQDFGEQEDENAPTDAQMFDGLAEHLASECFLSHRSKDIRIYVACSIADILRISAPNNPLKDVRVIMVSTFFLFEESI